MDSRLQLSDALFISFASLAHVMTGITIKPQRKVMLEGRLKRRVTSLDLSGFDEYLNYVKENKQEHQQFINAITTNETYVYRTPRIWIYISESFLPEWSECNHGKTLNVWSAASSTGEEATTAGIVLHDYQSKNPVFKYSITGTDIDSNVVSTAQAGLYKGRSIERFRQAQPLLFKRYMKGNDETGYQVVPEIKKHINFKVFNLSDEAHGTRFDLVLIRNVLIYFALADQVKVIKQVHSQLKPGGVAIIGESESLSRLNCDFTSIVPTVYRRAENSKLEKAV